MISDPSDDWVRMQHGAPGRHVVAVEQEYRDLIEVHELRGITDFRVELTARLLVDGAWLRRHPIDSLRFCWRHRHAPGAVVAMRALLRPRAAG